MKTSNKKSTPKSKAKLKDLKTKKNPKGGVDSIQWGIGRSSTKTAWIE